MRDRRRRTLGGALSALLLVLFVLAAAGGSGLAAGSSGSGTHVLAGPQAKASPQPGMKVGHSTRNDISPALRSIRPAKVARAPRSEAAENPSLFKGKALPHARDTVAQRSISAPIGPDQVSVTRAILVAV